MYKKNVNIMDNLKLLNRVLLFQNQIIKIIQ